MSRDEDFARWFERYNSRLVAQCVRILRDRAAAEDIAQETLLRAWLGRERMRHEDVGAWLSVVARNLCVSYLRHQKKQIPTESLPDTPDPSLDPARLVERKESRRAVRAALESVGPRHRELLSRHWMDGVEYEDLAGELGLSPSGTRAVLFRARRALRERLVAVGEGFAAIVVGARVRITGAANRARNSFGSFEPIANGALQAGMSFAVVVSLSVSGIGASIAPGLASAGARDVARIPAVSSRSVQQEMSSAPSTPAASRRHPRTTPLEPGPLVPHAGATIDPNNRTHDEDVGNQHFHSYESSGHSIVMDDVFFPTMARVCDEQPAACNVGV